MVAYVPIKVNHCQAEYIFQKEKCQGMYWYILTNIHMCIITQWYIVICCLYVGVATIRQITYVSINISFTNLCIVTLPKISKGFSQI
jgi:hypothetical protein